MHPGCLQAFQKSAGNQQPYPVAGGKNSRNGLGRNYDDPVVEHTQVSEASVTPSWQWEGLNAGTNFRPASARRRIISLDIPSYRTSGASRPSLDKASDPALCRPRPTDGEGVRRNGRLVIV